MFILCTFGELFFRDAAIFRMTFREIFKWAFRAIFIFSRFHGGCCGF
jgi:hypothetical protein